MKREILHPTCVPRPKGVTANTDPFELAEIMANGEATHRVEGSARGSYACDGCGGEITKGERAVAYSISSNRAPYFEWENDYIDT